MKVGDRVYIDRELEIFGSNKVTETLFISESIKSFSEERNIRINEILKK